MRQHTFFEAQRKAKQQAKQSRRRQRREARKVVTVTYNNGEPVIKASIPAKCSPQGENT